MRVVTWNLAHARGQGVRRPDRAAVDRTLDRIGAVVREIRPDLLALQELDHEDLDRLADRCELPHTVRGDHFALTVGRTEARSGTALLSAHPWVGTRQERFACCWRDNKGWVAGTVRSEGREVEVFSVHLDFLNPNVRVRQARSLRGQLAPDRPSIVVGDLNTPTDRGAIAELAAALRLAGPGAPTFPSRRPCLHLDRVLVSTGVRVEGVRVLDPILSDHRAVLADLRIA